MTLKTYINKHFQSPGASPNYSPCRELSKSWYNIDICKENDMFMALSFEIHDPQKDCFLSRSVYYFWSAYAIRLTQYFCGTPKRMSTFILFYSQWLKCIAHLLFDIWASSYEGLKWALEFRSQCCLLLFPNGMGGTRYAQKYVHF